MKKLLLHELRFFISVVLVFFVVFHFCFGLFPIDTESVVDINVHDTYFVIGTWIIVWFFLIISLYVIYLFRIVVLRFHNPISNWVFAIFGAVILLLFPFVFGFAGSMEAKPGWIIYPPLSAGSEVPRSIPGNTFTTFLRLLNAVLLAIEFFVFWQIGRRPKAADVT